LVVVNRLPRRHWLLLLSVKPAVGFGFTVTERLLVSRQLFAVLATKRMVYVPAAL
jgi:threonine/homoserine efflux transporter RhtA